MGSRDYPYTTATERCPDCSTDGVKHPAHLSKPCPIYVPYATDGWYCPCGRVLPHSTAETSS